MLLKQNSKSLQAYAFQVTLHIRVPGLNVRVKSFFVLFCFLGVGLGLGRGGEGMWKKDEKLHKQNHIYLYCVQMLHGFKAKFIAAHQTFCHCTKAV